MDAQSFQDRVARLERDSAAHPRLYLAKVAAMAGLGFLLMGSLLAGAGLGLLAIVGLAILAITSGGGALLLLFKLGKLLVLVAVPLWLLVQQSLKALLVRLPAPQGDPITAVQAPALFAAIDGMRRQLRGPRVHQVLLVDDMNAAVVQRPAFGLIGFPRNHLLLGLPLLEAMTPDEALAVVAHEYGHLAGAHGRFGAFIYRLRITWATIAGVAAQWQGFFGRLLGRAVAAYAPWFNAYTFVLARANEYQADRCGADLVGARVMAEALKRSDLAAPQYQAFLGQTFERVAHEPQPPTDLALRWAQATATTDAQAPRWLADALDRQGDVADTHPTLRQRLQALDALAAATEPPAARQGPSAAEAWLGGALPEWRARAQQRWAGQVAEGWAQRHQQIATQRGRLATLRAQPQRSADEELERLQLTRQLEPQTDLRTEFAAYTAAHPERVLALYLQASELLDHDDAHGLALLEQVMARDAEATLPACERAMAWCRAQGRSEAAEAYAARWRERATMEQARRAQADTLDTTHALEPLALDAAAQAALNEVIAKLDRRGVRALYLVRRVLPADPNLGSFVLGVDVGWWHKRLGRQANIVKRLAAVDWPLPLFVLSLDGRNARYGKRLRAVPGARLGG